MLYLKSNSKQTYKFKQHLRQQMLESNQLEAIQQQYKFHILRFFTFICSKSLRSGFDMIKIRDILVKDKGFGKAKKLKISVKDDRKQIQKNLKQKWVCMNDGSQLLVKTLSKICFLKVRAFFYGIRRKVQQTKYNQRKSCSILQLSLARVILGYKKCMWEQLKSKSFYRKQQFKQLQQKQTTKQQKKLSVSNFNKKVNINSEKALQLKIVAKIVQKIRYRVLFNSFSQIILYVRNHRQKQSAKIKFLQNSINFEQFIHRKSCSNISFAFNALRKKNLIKQKQPSHKNILRQNKQSNKKDQPQGVKNQDISNPESVHQQLSIQVNEIKSIISSFSILNKKDQIQKFEENCRKYRKLANKLHCIYTQNIFKKKQSSFMMLKWFVFQEFDYEMIEKLELEINVLQHQFDSL